MRGLRMRIPGSAVFTATFQALGSIPVAIDSAEMFVALQQHTIDGVEVGLDPLTAGKFYTIIKHVAMTNHVLTLLPIMGSKRKIEALPAPLQKIIREEAKATVPYSRAFTARQT